ncbi:glycosyltransferase family 8 protein, partial [Salmonella enterica]|nr:glycosyltransferase family 8 protein [Salmonella enterica]EDR4873126.1 glycosyltransferase family 8 protein [Salmonella enterica subsp. enterica serovar Saintpaul]
GRRLDIALCFDHGFIMPGGVAIYSIIENNKDIEYALKPKERCQVKITL